MEEMKIYFNPGDLVRCKHFENAPTMYVLEKVSRNIVDKSGAKDSIFLGIKCRWFDVNNVLREALFSSKDLIHV